MSMNVIQPQSKKKMGAGKIILIILGSLFFIGFIAQLGSKDKAVSAQNLSDNEDKENASSMIAIGQTLQTKYFAVMISKANVEKKVNTGNLYTDLPAEQGIKYLVLALTVKNTDSESRMITDGEVHINYNGKDYNFDKSETVMAEGFGLFLDQINPLTQKSTKVIYKLPQEVTGPAYYRPGRSSDEEHISLGNIE